MEQEVTEREVRGFKSAEQVCTHEVMNSTIPVLRAGGRNPRNRTSDHLDEDVMEVPLPASHSAGRAVERGCRQ